jgi:hypothetical protein
MLRIPHCSEMAVRLSTLRTGRTLLPRNINILFLFYSTLNEQAKRIEQYQQVYHWTVRNRPAKLFCLASIMHFCFQLLIRHLFSNAKQELYHVPVMKLIDNRETSSHSNVRNDGPFGEGDRRWLRLQSQLPKLWLIMGAEASREGSIWWSSNGLQGLPQGRVKPGPRAAHDTRCTCDESQEWNVC